GRALADSLDPDATARTLARQAVPFLADLAGVTLPGEGAQGWRTELAWAAAGAESQARRLTAADGPDDELRAAVERAWAGGRMEVLHELAVAYPPGGGEAGGTIRTAAVVPLRARGRTPGVL